MQIELRPRRQFRGYIEREERWACLVVHRRGGKTFHCIMDLIYRALKYNPRRKTPTRYAYIAPTREQAKDIAWSYLKEFTHQIPEMSKNEAELWVEFPNGARIRLYSGESYERMRGLYFDGVVIDEYADIDPIAWDQVIRPCLSDYKGWATFIGTPKGKNAFYRVHRKAQESEEWFSLLLKASESGIISEEELGDLEKNATTPETHAQEFECDFTVGIPGAIYAREIEKVRNEGQVCEFGYERGALVHTTWDIGSTENTSVVYWQLVGLTWRVIDHDIGLRFTVAERIAHMNEKGYSYGYHCLPHDAGSEKPNGVTFQGELEAGGLKNTRLIPRTHDVENRINRMYELLPNIWFRESKTRYLLESLEHYHRKESKDKAGYVENRIVKDWSSHDADAFGYLGEAIDAGLLEMDVMKRKDPHVTGRPRRAITGRGSGMTFGSRRR